MKEKEARKCAGTSMGLGREKGRVSCELFDEGKERERQASSFLVDLCGRSRARARTGSGTSGNGAVDFTEAGTKAVARHGRNKYETVALSVGAIWGIISGV